MGRTPVYRGRGWVLENPGGVVNGYNPGFPVLPGFTRFTCVSFYHTRVTPILPPMWDLPAAIKHSTFHPKWALTIWINPIRSSVKQKAIPFALRGAPFYPLNPVLGIINTN
jgi:hypothetical protein